MTIPHENSTSPSQEEPTSPVEVLDEDWFASGERASSPPPSSNRSPKARPAAGVDPIGDPLADIWFR